MSKGTEASVRSRIARGGRRGLADQLRQNVYLMKVDWALETDVGVPGRERRAIVRGLREDLNSEDPDRRMKEILQELGNPTRLAFSYAAEPNALRPKWIAGAVSAAVAIGVYWVLFVTYALGMLTVLHQSGVEEAHSVFFFTPTSVFDNSGGFGAAWDVSVQSLLVPLLIGAIVFLLVSRSWRLFNRG